MYENGAGLDDLPVLRVLWVVASRNDPVSALYLGRFAYSQLSTRVWAQNVATKLG